MPTNTIMVFPWSRGMRNEAFMQNAAMTGPGSGSNGAGVSIRKMGRRGRDAFRYSTNIENTTEYMSATNAGGDFNTGVLNTRNAGRIRGLTSPGITHVFSRPM